MKLKYHNTHMYSIMIQYMLLYHTFEKYWDDLSQVHGLVCQSFFNRQLQYCYIYVFQSGKPCHQVIAVQ